MGSPMFHAEKSVEIFGGKPDDYLDIHEFMDSSKAAVSDLRHRTLTHNSWFVTTVLERVFGPLRKNSDGRQISVREIGQQHVMDDFNGSYPTAQDFLQNIEWADWMENGKNGELPPSHKKLKEAKPPSPVIVEEGVELPLFPASRLDFFDMRPCARASVPGLMD